MKPRYSNPSHQRTYDALLAAACDPSSELFYQGRPHRGAGHRAAFWDGYAGLTRSANVVPRTLSAVCFAAGKAFAKTRPGIPLEDAVWTPGVTRQGDSINQNRVPGIANFAADQANCITQMTKKEFELIARLLKSKEPVISGVRQVLFSATTNAEAARNVGATPQAVHRSTKRFIALHKDICEAFK